MLAAMLSLLLAATEITNREAHRFVYSTEQGYDTSCGLTTLACLLDTYWSVPVNELSLAREFMTDRLSGEDFTISFADMVTILKAKGFAYAAFSMNFTQLKAAVAKYAPVIVHYDRPDGHFALALAVVDDQIVIADPAQGTVERERIDFEGNWSGKVLLAALPSGTLRRDILLKAVASVTGRASLLDREALRLASGSRW
jgi:predicted double-glycine peptidase